MSDKEPFTLDAAAAPERIAKHIARAGICSRREAERRIEDGRVPVKPPGPVATARPCNWGQRSGGRSS